MTPIEFGIQLISQNMCPVYRLHGLYKTYIIQNSVQFLQTFSVQTNNLILVNFAPNLYYGQLICTNKLSFFCQRSNPILVNTPPSPNQISFKCLQLYWSKDCASVFVKNRRPHIWLSLYSKKLFRGPESEF